MIKKGFYSVPGWDIFSLPASMETKLPFFWPYISTSIFDFSAALSVQIYISMDRIDLAK